MKILVLADEESRSLYEHYDPEKLKGIGLIIACGDLRRNYLDFFASMTNAPVIFVLGNHDGWYNPEDSSVLSSGLYQPDVYKRQAMNFPRQQN